ncbi:MAG: helix-turn-helix transcriptional regulator, partial [Candidatus Hodarchaeales archaeon]
KALEIEGLGEFIPTIHESLALLLLNKYREDKTPENRSALITRLEKFENYTKINNLIPSLCKICLIRARLAISEFDFNTAEKWLDKCKKLSLKHGLTVHQSFAVQELEELRKLRKKLKEIFEEEKKSIINSQMQIVANYLVKSNQIIRKLQKGSFTDDKDSVRLLEKKTQHEKILSLLRENQQGLLQKDIPSLTGLSNATVSRRVNELVESNLVERVPFGRSLRIRLKDDHY